MARQAVPELLTKLFNYSVNSESPIRWITSDDSYTKSEVSGLVIFLESLDDLENSDLHTWVQSPFPVLCILNSKFSPYFQVLSNKYPWVQYVLEDEAIATRSIAFNSFIKNVQQRQQDIIWGQELSVRSKELEEMASLLEQKVLEETATLEQTMKEEKRNLDFNGRLVVYLQALVKAGSIEEAFSAFEKALAFLGVWGESFLFIRKNTSEILITQDRKKTAVGNPFTASIQQEMAARIGRPLLAPQVEQIYLSDGSEGFLIIECPQPSKLNSKVLEFTQQLKDLLKSSLQNWVLEEAIENSIHLWEVAFDEMNEPVALITENFQLLRANQNFVRNSQWKSPLCYEVFAGRTAPCPGCPLVEMKSRSELILGSDTWAVSSAKIREQQIGDQKTAEKVYVHQYKDRTHEIRLMQQSIQSEKLASLGKLAGHVANELNNPIGGIRNQVQLMLAEVDKNSELGSDLIEVEKAATRSLRIISNLLDFSQGKNVETEFSLETSVESVFSFLKTSLRGHKIEILLPSEPVTILGNVQLFQQALFNLVNNGLQAMQKPGRLKLEAKEENSVLTVKVTDEGVGIPLGLQKKIFEPFFTTKDKEKGTGLGLALVADVVEQMEGRIYFHSQPGQGTTFFLEVPLRKSNEKNIDHR